MPVLRSSSFVCCVVVAVDWVNTVATGKVLQFDEVRGFGFIAPDGGGEDVFIHVNDLDDDKRLLVPGVSVEFAIEEGDRGLKASGVRIIERTPKKAEPAGLAEAGAADSVVQPTSGADGDRPSARELEHEFTESLLTAAPNMAAGEVVQARRQLMKLAQAHGWIES